MYDAQGSDDGREWVEIYNNGTSTVDISSWKFFESDTNHNLVLIKGQSKISPSEYAVIANDSDKFLIDFPDYQGALFKSSFSLSNDGEILAIKNADLKINEVDYKSQWGADGNGKSLQLINGQWQEAVPTPGKENSASQTNSNQPPIAVFNFSPLNPTINQAITFNAASSTDPDNNISLYEWNFGNNDSVSSTEAATEYVYSAQGDYDIELKVFDAAGLYSIATSTISISPSQNQNQNSEILISEIVYGGSGSDAGKEFIELYNTSIQKDLNVWSLKYQKASSSKITTLAVFGSQPQDATIIPEKGFLLIGLNNYNSVNYSGINSDVKRSASLPNGSISDTPITIFLFDENGKEISRAVYDFDSAQDGKSWERKVLDSGSGNCEISQGNYEFNGNDCNKDNNQADFSARDIPNPQNSQNLPEPRQKPTTPADFNIVFDSAESKLNLSWTASTDSTGNSETIVYKIKDISSSTILLPDIETSSTSTVIPINELERNYKFSLQAFDKDGLWSELAEKEILVSNNSSVGQIVLQQNLSDAKSGPAPTVYFLQFLGNNVSTTVKSIEIFGESESTDRWQAGICEVPADLSNTWHCPEFSVASGSSQENVSITKTLLNFVFDNPVILEQGTDYGLFVRSYDSPNMNFAGASIYGSSNNNYQEGNLIHYQYVPGYGGAITWDPPAKDMYFILRSP